MIQDPNNHECNQDVDEEIDEEKKLKQYKDKLPLTPGKPYNDIEKCYSLLNTQTSLNILSQLAIAIDVQLGVLQENDPEDIAKVAKEKNDKKFSGLAGYAHLLVAKAIAREKPYLKQDYQREVEISYLLLKLAEEEGIKYLPEAKSLKGRISLKNDCSSFMTIFVFILFIGIVIFLLTYVLPKLNI